ncbi:MAG: cation:proton antiporter, partial [Microcystis sp.]
MILQPFLSSAWSPNLPLLASAATAETADSALVLAGVLLSLTVIYFACK